MTQLDVKSAEQDIYLIQGGQTSTQRGQDSCHPQGTSVGFPRIDEAIYEQSGEGSQRHPMPLPVRKGMVSNYDDKNQQQYASQHDFQRHLEACHDVSSIAQVQR
jgi:hypothetical protein